MERRLGERRALAPRAGGDLWPVSVRTVEYVAASLALCRCAIGYPVAYYIARHASRTKSLLLILLVLPFWISYLMRMLAWVNLLEPGRIREPVPPVGAHHQPAVRLARRAGSITVILGLVYGYIPFLILPLYAALDRIDKSLLEAARDLGASPFRTFLHVTLPLSKTGHPRRLPSSSPCRCSATTTRRTSSPARRPRRCSGTRSTCISTTLAADHRRGADAPAVGVPGDPHGLLHDDGGAGDEGAARMTDAAVAAPRRRRRTHAQLGHEPVGAAAVPGPASPGRTSLWSIVPVLIAVQYSFNDSRSRTIWAGFSTRWYTSDPATRSARPRACTTRSRRA